MKCPKCQHENPDEAKFCIKCGNPMEFHCPKCGANTPVSGDFCMECGRLLKEAPPVDYSQPQSYTPKHIKDKILTTRSAIEGERKLVTVFFADVANYTSISEKLDPEEVHQIMDGCFKILMDEIHKYEGTINQFTGDGVMALFGAPVAHEDHAQRACYAALSIQHTISEYGEKIKKDTGIDFKMRIGLNSGPVIVGSIGDDLRMDYSALGDTTNLAARMEQAAKPGSILISEQTHKIIESHFQVNPLGKLSVKGKEEPQEAYELVKASEVTTRIEASAAKGLTRFVGRKNSMASLMEAWEKAKSGSGQVVGIIGEAGVGKSRLYLEFRNKVAQGNCNFLQGHCLHYGSNMPYLPVLDIIKAYFDITEDDREYIIRKKIREGLDESLADTIAPFQELLSQKSDDESFSNLEAKQKRDRTFEAIRDLLLRLSEDQPVILVIEDLHWIDNTSQEFLDYMIGWIAAKPVLLVLLYRPEYTHQWGSKSYYNRIGLDHLGTESSTELVRAMLEEGEIAPELRDMILERAAGNPLFMEEFTHSLQENGTILKQDNRYVLSRSISELDVPHTVQGIIAARMDRLEDNLKRTMQVASVIGRDFAYRILQNISGMKEELKSYLLNLQGLEFIFEKSLFPELEYIFKHALTRDIAYNSLLLKKRKEIHENTGKAIEEIYGDRLDEFYEMLSYHYSKSDNREKAYHFLRLSGEKAAKKYSNWEAVGFYEEALNILKSQPENEENKKAQIEVIGLMLGNLAVLGFPENSPQILQEWEKLINDVGDEKNLFHYYQTMGGFYTYKGNLLTAIKYYENSYYEANKAQDLELIVISATALMWPYYSVGQFHKVIEIAPKVIDLIEKEERESDLFGGSTNRYTQLCGYYGRSLGALGRFDEGKIFCEKALRNAVNIVGLGFSEMNYALLFRWQGDGCRVIEHSKKCLKYLEEVNYSALLGFAWMNLGVGYHFLGDLEKAGKYLEKGLEIQREAEVELALSGYSHFLSLVYCDSGDLKKAQSCAEKAVELSQKYNERYIEGQSRISLGRIIGKKDPTQYDKAKESILQGIKILEGLMVRSWVSQGYLFLGKLYADAGQKEKALENLKKTEEEFKDMGMDYWLARTYAVYADLYKNERDQLKAREKLTKSIEILKGCGADGWVEKYEKELAAIS